MKKNTKKILFITGLIIAIIIGIASFGYLKMQSEMQSLTPIDTGRIVSNVFAVRTKIVDFFIVCNADSFIAIDAGTDKVIAAQELQKCGIDASKVAGVFLTHTDWDHIAAIPLFPHARIFISRQEEQMINGKTARALIMKNKLEYPYTLLDDNQTISIGGFTVKGILTPGHTPGSMSFVVNDSCLFTGDNLSLKKGVARQFTEFFNMDTKMQLQSLPKISNIPNVKYVFTAHHGFSNDYRKVFENFRN